MNKEWIDVRERLLDSSRPIDTLKTVELLDLCTKSDKILSLEPCISLDRLCLQIIMKGEKCIDYGCLYFYKNQYIASSYDNTKKYYFEKSKDAVDFFEKNMPLE
jgi:hypothetical protein